jgi:hypothetical protein
MACALHAAAHEQAVLVDVVRDHAQAAARRQEELRLPVLPVARVAAGHDVHAVRQLALREPGPERGLAGVVYLGIGLAQQPPGLKPALLREGEHRHAVELLDGALPVPARHDREHLVPALDEVLADGAGRTPEAAVLAPGEDLDADQADPHWAPPPPPPASSEYCSGAQG